MDSYIMERLKEAVPLNIVPQYDLAGKCAGLVIIDEVNGFCTVGAGNLAPQIADASIDVMVSKTVAVAREGFGKRDLPILAFEDTHEPGVPEPPYPPHCERGTGEEILVPGLQWLYSYSSNHLQKDCINGFVGGIREDGSNVVADFVNREHIETLVITGICTDICVLDFVVTMLSARNHRFPCRDYGLMPTLKNIVVLVPACATYDLPIKTAIAVGLPEFAAHPRELTHYMGLYFMASRGAILANDLIF
ncbi:MAG: isochorismatase family protein [bacterium]|nr:isochorismatase family protein [bacterium]